MDIKIFILTFFISVVAIAQDKRGVIHFKDGTQKVGYVKYKPKGLNKHLGINDKLKYRVGINSKEIVEFDLSDIEKIDLNKNGVISTYYLKIPAHDPSFIVEVVLEVEDKLSLFSDKYYSDVPNYDGRFEYKEYYVQKKGGDFVHFSPGILNSNAIEEMSEYFSDCPKLVGYIKKRTFAKYVKNHPDFKGKSRAESRMNEIMKYYNTKCIADK